MISKRSVFYRISIFAASGVILHLLGFAYRIFLGRAAGAEGMGVYQLVLPFYSFLQALTLSGLTTAVSALSASEAASGTLHGAQAVLRRGQKLFLLLFFTVALVVVFGANRIGTHILGNPETRASLLLLLPCLLLTGFENLYKNYFYGIGLSRAPVISELTEQTVRFLAVALLLFFRKPQHAGELCACIVLGMIASEVVSVILLSCFFPKAPRGTTRANLLAIALPLTISAVLNSALSSLGAVLIPRRLVLFGLSQTQAIAQYGILFGMTLPLLSLPFAFLGPITLVLVPLLSQSSTLGNTSDLRRKSGKSLHICGILASFSAAILLPLANPVSQLFYKQQIAEAWLLPLCLTTFFGFYQLLSAAILSGIGKQNAVALHTIAGGLIRLLGTLLVSRFGILAFLIGDLLSTLFVTILNLRAVIKTLALRVSLRNWLGAPVLSGVLTALCVRAVLLRLLADAFPPALAVILAFALGCALFLCALRAQGTSPTRYFETLIPQQSSSQTRHVPLPRG